jgi:hypothetical protein
MARKSAVHVLANEVVTIQSTRMGNNYLRMIKIIVFADTIVLSTVTVIDRLFFLYVIMVTSWTGPLKILLEVLSFIEFIDPFFDALQMDHVEACDALPDFVFSVNDFVADKAVKFPFAHFNDSGNNFVTEFMLSHVFFDLHQINRLFSIFFTIFFLFGGFLSVMFATKIIRVCIIIVTSTLLVVIIALVFFVVVLSVTLLLFADIIDLGILSSNIGEDVSLLLGVIGVFVLTVVVGGLVLLIFVVSFRVLVIIHVYTYFFRIK